LREFECECVQATYKHLFINPLNDQSTTTMKFPQQFTIKCVLKVKKIKLIGEFIKAQSILQF